MTSHSVAVRIPCRLPVAESSRASSSAWQAATTVGGLSVASTLLSAAASYGEEHNCEIVVAAVPVHSREPHRYLTKIGFNQVAVLRAIQASKLRSRLTMKATNSRDTGKLIAVRRTLRRRTDARGHSRT